MTKIYIAKPPETPPPITSPQTYSISPETRISMQTESYTKDPLTYDIPGKGRYAPTDGWEFNFELNLLDSDSRLPIRACEVVSGDHRAFTDPLGRVIFTLNRGLNKVAISGAGYVESGSFTPKLVQFDPMLLDVHLDSDSIYTVYSSGEIVPGERKLLDNPGHHGGTFNLEVFLRNYWWVLGTVGIAGVGMYYLGKSKN